MIKARVRVGATWTDACILNLSGRGMLVQSGSVPSRGNYLEIRRGRHVVIARVVWSADQRFGVSTQDPICPDELIKEVDNSSPGRSGGSTHDRRSLPRPASVRHEASRTRGRALEFGTLALMGALCAGLMFVTIEDLLRRPLSAVGIALASGKAG